MDSRLYPSPYGGNMKAASKPKSSLALKSQSSTKVKRGNSTTLSMSSQPSPSIKSKRTMTYEEDEYDTPPKKKRAVKKKDEEKRIRVFRKRAPRSFLERLARAQTQRMFLIDRKRKMSLAWSHEEEVFDIAGTTGNIYQVTISKQPTCTCPDNEKGNQCKHIVYVLAIVLKAPEDLVYQLALLSTELATIFAGAPVTPQSSPDAAPSSSDTGGNRKPIEGDCPVCVMEFDPSDKSEEIIWCKAACGNNVHKHCFEQWAKSKPGKVVKCVYCRTPWKGDEDSIKRINKNGKKNAEGYVNVASQLGISGQRDMSTYHQPWVQRRFGDAYDYWDGY